MGVEIKTGAVKTIAEETKAEAVVKLAFKGIKTGEAKFADTVPADATYRYVINVSTAGASTKEIMECYKEVIKIAEEKGINSVVFPLLGSDDKDVEIPKIVRVALGVLYEADDNITLILAMPECIKSNIDKTIPHIERSNISNFVNGNAEYAVGAHNSSELLSQYISINRGELTGRVPEELIKRLVKKQNELSDENCREIVGEIFAPYIAEDQKRVGDYFSIEGRHKLLLSENGKPYISRGAFYDLVQGRGNTRPSKDNLVLAAWAYEFDIHSLCDLLGRVGYQLSDSVKDELICYAFENSGNYNIDDIDTWLFALNKSDITFEAVAAKNRRRAERKKDEE